MDNYNICNYLFSIYMTKQSDPNREYAKAVRILRAAYIFAIMNIIMFIFLVMTAFKAIKYG